jgi:hypothetical protein
MATNGMLIEFGAEGKMNEESYKGLQAVISTLGGFKRDGLVDEFRFYAIVTGNRSQRVASIMLETSHEQLEALVVNPVWGKLMEDITTIGTNVTTNRAITLERLQELAPQFMER